MQRAHLGFSEERIAGLGAFEQGFAVVGAFVGGFIADRFGQRKTIAALMLGIGISIAILAASPGQWPSFTFLATWISIQTCLVYAYNAATLGFFMTISNPAIGATQFALFMAGTNLTYSWTAPAGGWVADNWGYGTLFAIAAVVQIVTIPLLAFCDPKEAERRFRGTTVLSADEASAGEPVRAG
jgi:PAT family beta-lactamase induction signal transducer AmpG